MTNCDVKSDWSDAGMDVSEREFAELVEDYSYSLCQNGTYKEEE